MIPLKLKRFQRNLIVFDWNGKPTVDPSRDSSVASDKNRKYFVE